MAWPIGSVHLNVEKLDRSIRFYENTIGFETHRREGDTAYLRARGGAADLLVLTEQPNGKPSSGGAGLYHFAILVPSRLDLARTLRHLAETRTPLDGISDHYVSEAIYLPDPDGNGIEIYRDRPRTEWPYTDGQLEMGTVALDVDGVMSALDGHDAAWAGLPGETIIGHMHLHVADIPAAERFYREVLGFDLMVRYGSAASFLSYEGYHHHLGINRWKRGEPTPIRENTLGLRWFTLRPPDVDAIRARIEAAGIAYVTRDDGLLVRDPVGNGVLLVTSGH
jgi:catechol 2,3-dioxygenase